jgi:hypothetical protein
MNVIQPKALILALATAATTTLSLPMAALADTYVVEVIHARGEYYGIVVNNTTGEDLSVTEGHKNPAKAARQARRAAKRAAKEGDDIISGESACAMWPETCF